ncbi:PepSY domain-containing protein [Aurantiacibacter spongiae]|uniref:PepSY domain-containing protein n=1 Tax=Aurantiacibacter spongiae TaxID=2488860 RepID=A0A3N5DNQ1_9SPHN|nr:PepSY domain-containing protein [Aurantiacibacter spongiae]RPF70701.1 PepSY domain-containing protein [Aurantiacibacter spongiae]
MGHQRTMRRFAKWHVWLGWLVGLPILMWTVTGLVMVARPIEYVHGDQLRKEVSAALLPPGNPAPLPFPANGGAGYTEMRVAMQDGRPVWFLTTAHGEIERYAADSTGAPLSPIDEDWMRRMVAERIVGGDRVESVRRFPADDPPFDFRRSVPVWQVALEDGAHVYVDARTGKIAAVRTRFWRVFDVMWGLHIMDLQSREDTSHPVLILFATLGVAGSLLGCVLMFRRRRARPGAKGTAA